MKCVSKNFFSHRFKHGITVEWLSRKGQCSWPSMWIWASQRKHSLQCFGKWLQPISCKRWLGIQFRWEYIGRKDCTLAVNAFPISNRSFPGLLLYGTICCGAREWPWFKAPRNHRTAAPTASKHYGALWRTLCHSSCCITHGSILPCSQLVVVYWDTDSSIKKLQAKWR